MDEYEQQRTQELLESTMKQLKRTQDDRDQKWALLEEYLRKRIYMIKGNQFAHDELDGEELAYQDVLSWIKLHK
jgi:hypothetical protein